AHRGGGNARGGTTARRFSLARAAHLERGRHALRLAGDSRHRRDPVDVDRSAAACRDAVRRCRGRGPVHARRNAGRRSRRRGRGLSCRRWPGGADPAAARGGDSGSRNAALTAPERLPGARRDMPAVALSVLTRVVRTLGPLRGAGAAAVGAAWYARLSRDDRVRVAANHHRLQPQLDHASAAALARRSYQEYVRMIVDSMWAEPLDSAQVLELFRVIGAEHLDVGDRGSMVVLPHFGNWDMAASASLGLGLHLSTVMAPVVSPGITEMVALSRRRKGLEIFTVRQSARGLYRALRRGRTVALMLDVPEAGPTVVVP